MSLASAIVGLSAPVAGRTTLSAARLEEECRSIRDKYPAPKLVTDSALSALVELCLSRITSGNWRGATEANILPLVHALCRGGISEPTKLIEFLCREVNLTRRTSFLAAAMEGYLEGWSGGSTHTRRAAALLQERQRDLPEPYSDCVSRAPECLDPDSGARSIAARILESDEPLEAMSDLGFGEPFSPGFATEVGNSFVQDYPLPESLALAQRLALWARPENGGGIGDEGLIGTLEKLLSPWHQRVPTEGIQAWLLNWVLEHIGDPRKPGESGHWLMASETSKRTVLTWLAGQSIEAFMSVISAVEIERPDMWSERRNFWMSLYKEGVITEAWVALHPAAQREAKRRFEETKEPSFEAFAQQLGGRKDTSLLIMRAGDHILVEGSKNYRIHVFDRDFPGRPELYRDSYRDQDITLSPSNHPATKYHRGGINNWGSWVRRQLR